MRIDFTQFILRWVVIEIVPDSLTHKELVDQAEKQYLELLYEAIGGEIQ